MGLSRRLGRVLRKEGHKRRESTPGPGRDKQLPCLVRQPEASLGAVKWHLAPDIGWGKLALA